MSAGYKTEVVSIDDLTVDPANVREHGERNKSTIGASLKAFGPARSIVVDGKGIVRAGNGTIEQARALGISEVLVVDPKPGQVVAVRRKEWSTSEAVAYAIMDNRSGELADWDDIALAEQIAGLRSEDVGWESIGFSQDEYDKIIKDLGDAELSFDDEKKSSTDAVPNVVSLHTLSIVLTEMQYGEWQELREELQTKSDTATLIKIAGLSE